MKTMPRPIAQILDRGGVAHLAVEVDGDDCARSRGDRAFDASRVDVEIVVVNVDEYGACARLQDDVGGGCEGEGGDDDFVVGRAAGHWADAVGEEGEVEGGGAAVDGDGVLCAGVVGEGLLECCDALSLG